ncbi:nucleoside deaminase [Nitratireductor sp. XY-223]|uniref:nucleoside deaminase n=1 Tax=Nitratireductor sp. XY-223 TaxID=2561926 RepID=UPI00197D29C3|nr:nucleoside deaminase [Nitratireductor sp. XY-223]
MQTDIYYLRKAIEISHESRKQGNHPFGACLVNADGDIVITSGNTYSTDLGIGHAELNVARQAAVLLPADQLLACTLVTSVEPCCMCAGGTYWAGIGSLVFGLTEKRLAELTGNNPENLTMDLPCHTVFDAGQRKVNVRGPYPELEQDIIAAHKDFW